MDENDSTFDENLTAAGLVSRRLVLERLALAAAAGGAVVTVPGCVATNAATGRTSFTGSYTPDDDVRIGRQEHPKLLEAFGGTYERPKLNRYIAGIGKKLAVHTEYRQFPYQFTVLNSPIVNAFALPGGFVYVSRGLLALASNEAELAGVLAHELGHVNARHSAERASAAQVAQLGVVAAALGAAALGVRGDTVARLGQGIAMASIQSYSRRQEFEADKLGVRYLSRAGYEPDAMVTFLSTLREHSQLEARALGLPAGKVDEFNFMSTHPRTIDRVERAAKEALAERPRRPRVGRKVYLENINGMMYGDDPRQGLVKGQRFVHPDLRFEFEFPKNYRIQNGKANVVGSHPKGAGIIFDLAQPKRARDPESYIRGEWAPRAPLAAFQKLRINGMPAATALGRAKTRRGPADVRLLAIRGPKGIIYRFLFVSPGQETPGRRRKFQQVGESFRRLSAREAKAISPLRLLVVGARPGDTVKRLSDSLPHGPLNPAWFRMMNDIGPRHQPRPRQAVKVVAS